MKPLVPHSIPDDILDIELKNITEALDILKEDMNRARTDQFQYIKSFTAMIHLNEAAESINVKKYDLQKVKIVLHSTLDRVFKIEYDVSYDFA